MAEENEKVMETKTEEPAEVKAEENATAFAESDVKEEVVFAIIVLIMSFPIVGIIDYLIDKYGLNEEDLNHLEL